MNIMAVRAPSPRSLPGLPCVAETRTPGPRNASSLIPSAGRTGGRIPQVAHATALQACFLFSTPKNDNDLSFPERKFARHGHRATGKTPIVHRLLRPSP